MKEKHLFEYAVVRAVPRVEREEFINVGVILLCSSQGFLQTSFELNKDRLQAFCKELNISELEDRLKAFQQICEGSKHGGPIGKLPLSGRFRWLTANRSTIVQTSPVHPGMCDDAKQMLERLMEELVK